MASVPQRRLLCLSNGHGEDAIALRILMALQAQPHPPHIEALPLVGDGHIYRQHAVPIAGSTQTLPSGGFIYMDGRQLMRDVGSGLISLTLHQIRVCRRWARSGGAILAVGDIVPLLFAWMSGASYGFVGTAKSEYYLRDEQGVLPRPSWFEQLESWSGCVYLPWERWLMGRSRCQGVFPRDTLTATVLKQWAIPVFDLGNPMMDGLEAIRPLTLPQRNGRHPLASLTMLLLPGSRSPEVYRNWTVLLAAVQSIQDYWHGHWGEAACALVVLAAIAPRLDRGPFYTHLQQQGWQQVLPPASDTSGQAAGIPTTAPSRGAPADVADDAQFVQATTRLVLTTRFEASLNGADVAIAMAGTATEQFVGLGKPALIVPGDGPQFTPAFAEAQTRLLGESVILVDRPEAVGMALARLMDAPERLDRIRRNGKRRMGTPGASDRIARQLIQMWGWEEEAVGSH